MKITKTGDFFGLTAAMCASLYPKNGSVETYRQRHGHDHVAPVDRRYIEDAGARMGVYPLHGAGRLADPSRRPAQGRRERPDRVPHQYGWIGLDCRERERREK